MKTRAIMLRIVKRILHVFNGTAQCHAQADQALRRSQEACARAKRVLESRQITVTQAK